MEISRRDRQTICPGKNVIKLAILSLNPGIFRPVCSDVINGVLQRLAPPSKFFSIIFPCWLFYPRAELLIEAAAFLASHFALLNINKTKSQQIGWNFDFPVGMCQGLLNAYFNRSKWSGTLSCAIRPRNKCNKRRYVLNPGFSYWMAINTANAGPALIDADGTLSRWNKKH